MMRKLLPILLLLPAVAAAGNDLPLHLLKVLKGCTIRLFARDIPNARSLTLGEKGTVFVGSRTAGKV